MIDFKVLGGLELRGDDGQVLHSVLSQPKRQALLACLALSIPRGFHRRDTLLGLLWPELDETHARAALSKAVHHLRASLGAGTVLNRGTEELGLDWQRVWCDAAGFEAALDRGELAEGLALYRGDLLPGFYLDDAAEFDQWLEAERARLRARAVEAALSLSATAESAGQLDQAVHWLRRAVTLAPFDEPAVRSLMSLLDRRGDRAGALRTYEDLSSVLRGSLDIEPAPETTEVMEGIRARGVARRRTGRAEVLPELRDPAPVTTAPQSADASSDPAPMPAPARARRSIGHWATAALVATLALLTFALLSRQTVEDAPASQGSAVAIVPFVVDGDTTQHYLHAGIVTLLAERFNRAGELQAINPHAILSATAGAQLDDDPVRALATLRRLRPRFLVTGRIVARNDSATISALMFDTLSLGEPVARAAVAGLATDIARLSDELAWQLSMPSPGTAQPGAGGYGTLTGSLDALKAYLGGESAYAAGRFQRAVELYRAAVQADTTFALAYLWLSRAANWTGDLPLATWALDHAMRYSDRLPLLDQFRVRAWHAYESGNVEEAERLFRLVLANDPGVGDAWLALGELRYHWGPLLGWTVPEARAAFEESMVTGLSDVSALVHLARIAAAQDRLASLDSLQRIAAAAGADSAQTLELAALRAFASGDAAAQQRVMRALAGLDDAAAYGIALMVAVHATPGATPQSIAAGLLQPHRAPIIRASGALLGAEVAMARGRRDGAKAALSSGNALTHARVLEYRTALALLPLPQADAAELSELRALLRRESAATLFLPGSAHYIADGIYPPRRYYLMALIDITLGDSAAAAAIADTLDAPGASSGAAYARHAAALIRAELLRRRGRPADALATLPGPAVLPDRVLPGVLAYPSAHERFLRAELLLELGREAEALRWYQTFPDPAGYDLMYLALAHFRQGEILERRGDRAAARAAYARVVQLWADADPAFQPWVQAARARLAALQA